MGKCAKHIIFSGRVQGVGFRYTARTSAVKFGLTGFVRNLPDGTVEMVIQGEPSDIDMCLKDIADYFGGYIKDSRITEISYQNQYRDFAIY